MGSPPRPLTLESAIEVVGTDELVEVTPSASACASGSSRPATQALTPA